MEVIEKRENDVCVLQVMGRLDSNTSPDFEKKVFEAIESGVTRLVVDCEGLEFVASAGFRVILRATRRLKKTEGMIVFCCIREYIREVFEMAGFDSFLPVAPNREEALKALAVE
ncbi:STAS domain-containing protein [Thermodesulfobacteriota bacterium]